MPFRTIRVVDSHTGGEPTRVVLEGGPELPDADIERRVQLLRDQHDSFRRAVVTEPRGSDALVGALLHPARDRHCLTSVIFFNNVGYLGMCVHGTIGVVTTLAHSGRIGAGNHRIETPAGEVQAQLHENGDVTVTNVASHRLRANVSVDVPGHGKILGDVVWAGNWFFVVDDHGQTIAHSEAGRLTKFTQNVRQALRDANITGDEGHEIDHVALFNDTTRDDAQSTNFVLCPGGAYDRSPCGTGTSAKLVCLHGDGKLTEGESWRQRGLLGSVFVGTLTRRNGVLFPAIRGRAHIMAEATLVLDDADPFRTGFGN